ncbi:MAG: dTDP-4-dehydrorhamnose reductase [Bacteroidales bacterium]|nr:dTDP-4-dehydrorhamnose reductase [Bacteroidales bacterium]MBO7257301.1 dTDP-4-dehydrorhamnose reductase [Bacteroidales bacterium]MBO7284478.1 dTDP-4-dehydrorhamnose reductase [Bacteroidales bacterium]
MENILITGAKGQLGSELKVLSQKNPSYNYYFTDIEELDITSAEAIENFVTANNITKIINCAAYNDVNGAESNFDEAVRLNVTAVASLAECAAKHDIYLIHFSSDYVFNGKKKSPYHESDRAFPISAYGKTKLAGEIAIKKSGAKSIIIRTAWLYSQFGNNFVKKMIQIGLDEYDADVVADCFGSPTSAKELAEAVFHIIPQLDATPRYGEVFHYSSEGVCSWAEFAEKIMKLKQLDCTINPLLSEAYPAAAKRPAYSVLDKTLIKTVFGVKTYHWEKSLSKVIKFF